MPIEFLRAEQEQAYGRYVGPPSTQQLSRYFHLDDADVERLNQRRGAHNKLGFVMWTFGRLGARIVGWSVANWSAVMEAPGPKR